MKTFAEWLADNHPEMLDEGVLQNIANSRTARSLVAGTALAAGSLGLGSRAMAANPTKPAATNNDEEHDEDFIDDMSSDEGIADQKAKMLKMAQKVPMKTQASKGVEVSRGSARLAGGKIEKNVKDQAAQQPRKFEPTKAKLPTLPSGKTASPDWAAE